MTNPPKEPIGRAKGGHATAEKLTPEERSARARKGAKARWAKKSQEPEVKRGMSGGMAAAALDRGGNVINEDGAESA